MFRRVIVLYWCAVAFNIASAMEANQSSNLYIVIRSVLGSIPFEFQEDKDNIYITTNPDNAAETSRVLTEAVSSRDGFLKHFSGKTSLEISSDKVDARPFSSFCGERRDDAIKLAKDLFGDDIFDGQGFIDGNFNSFSDGKLQTRPFGKNARLTLSGFRDAVLSCFVGREIPNLRDAFICKEKCLPPQDLRVDKECAFLGLIGVGVNIIPVDKDSLQLSIDLKRMHQLCFPPQIKQEKLGNKVRFAIDREHLVLFLKQTTCDDVLLRYVTDGEQVYAQQIYWRENIRLPEIPYVALLIDHSGSMAKEIESLKRALTKAIEEIWTENSHTIISFTPFASTVEETSEFSFEQREMLYEMVNQLKANGETVLEDALITALGRINKNKLMEKFFVNLILFTDGHNQFNGCIQPIDRSGLLSRVRETNGGVNKLTVTSLGIGDVDKCTLDVIACATYGKSLQLSGMNDFSKDLVKSVKCDNQIKFVRVMLDLNNEAAEEALVPVRQDRAGIYLSKFYLPVNKSFDPEQGKIDHATTKDLARIEISNVFSKAWKMVNNTEMDISELENFYVKLKKDRPESAQVVRQFFSVLNLVRQKVLTEKDAKDQLSQIVHQSEL